MLPIELNSEQESKLEYIAMTQGVSKNQVVVAAIEHYLNLQDSESIPLKERALEALYETHVYNLLEEKKELSKAVQVAWWASDGGNWSAKPPRHLDGSSTGALYGSNKVLGYIRPQNNNVYVLSKYLGPLTSLGVASYRYDVMQFDKWKECMVPLPNS